MNVSAGVPAWTTFSGGGMTLLSTTTLSGTSTTISSISQSYTNLLIQLENVGFSVAAALRIKLYNNNNSKQTVFSMRLPHKSLQVT